VFRFDKIKMTAVINVYQVHIMKINPYFSMKNYMELFCFVSVLHFIHTWKEVLGATDSSSYLMGILF
jgi:hypothetical protein